MTDTAPAPLTLAIFGASGATGKQAIEAARKRGHSVRAFDHDLPETPSQDPKVTHYQADVLTDDLSDNLRGVDAVLSCLGVGNDLATLLSPPPLYSQGTTRICDGMEIAGVQRIIVISANFVEEKNRGPIWFKLPAMVGLHRIFDQMAEMEHNLRHRTTLDWTAVRPGWLMEGPGTDDYTVQADTIPPGMVRSRHADVAAFMVQLAETGEWSRATPAIAREEPASATSPAAVMAEFTR